MTNLFEEYPSHENQSQKINLFNEYNENNSEGTHEEALNLAKKQISAANPHLPDWLRDAILSITPKEKSPLLESAAKGITDVTNYIPAAVGGALQGASIPIRGVAGLIPTEFTQNLANSRDLRNLFPEAEGTGQKTAQVAGELLGGGGLFGKLFQGAKYAAEAAKIPKILQNATALSTAGAIGTPGTPLERTLGGAGALALGGAGKLAGKAGEALPKIVKGLFSESTPEALVNAVQKPHDVLERSNTELYDQVNKAIGKRNIKIPMKEELLEQAKEYFPQRTTATKDLFERAKNGDYKAIHDIQSALYTKGKKQITGDDLVKENEGEEILDLRDRMNDFVSKDLIKEGHLDIAHVANLAKKGYSELMNTYYPKNLRQAIGKMVQTDLRLIPENPHEIFKQNSVPMKTFLEKHPEVAKHAKNLAEREKAIKALKKIGYAMGGTGASIAGIKAIYDSLK